MHVALLCAAARWLREEASSEASKVRLCNAGLFLGLGSAPQSSCHVVVEPAPAGAVQKAGWWRSPLQQERGQLLTENAAGARPIKGSCSSAASAPRKVEEAALLPVLSDDEEGHCLPFLCRWRLVYVLHTVAGVGDQAVEMSCAPSLLPLCSPCPGGSCPQADFWALPHPCHLGSLVPPPAYAP